MRVKTGIITKRRHKKVTNLAKGYWRSHKNTFRKAKEAVLHAGQYAFAGRKMKKRDFRTLWIIRINAALKQFEIKYSRFIKALHSNNIQIDRKMLAKLAVEEPKAFEAVVKTVK